MRSRIVAAWFAALLLILLGQAAPSLAQQDTESTKTGSISGTVTYTDGRPVALYPVDFRPVDKPENRNKVRTDKEGRYLITGLAEGEYFVGFVHPSRVPADQRAALESIPESAPGLDPADAPLARRVKVTAGGDSTNVDFVLIDTGAERIAPETVDTGTDAEALPGTGGFAREDKDNAGLLGVALTGVVAVALLGIVGVVVRKSRSVRL